MFFYFFFNDTATTEIYTLSLHDALPICERIHLLGTVQGNRQDAFGNVVPNRLIGHVDSRNCSMFRRQMRSEEHTSELQSQSNLVCRLLLEKKKKKKK